MTTKIPLFGVPCGGCGQAATVMELHPHVHVVRHARTADVPCRFVVSTPPSDRILPAPATRNRRLQTAGGAS